MRSDRERVIECSIVGCTERAYPRVCPGDHASHHHGAIHFAPGTALDDGGVWGWVCIEHYRQAEAEWAERRSST